MKETDKKMQGKKKITKVKTFSVPLSIAEIEQNMNISTQLPSEISKEEIINQAFNFHSLGNISEAVKHYKYFIDQGFNDPQVFSNYGVILKDIGQLKEAEELLRKAIEIKPDFAQAHTNLGDILSALGKSQEAELSLRQAIKLEPNLAQAHHNLGNFLQRIGKYDESISCYKMAIEKKKNYKKAIAAMGKVLTLKGNYKDGLQKIKEGYGSIIFDHITPVMRIHS